MDKNIIFNDLKKQILSGRFPPGQSLTERDLCKYYGISRTPLREILFRIVNIGLVKKDRGKGFFVRKLDLKLLFEVFEARESIEGIAARLCTQRMTEQDKTIFLSLKEGFTAGCPGGDSQKILKLGRELHRTIMDIASNSLLIDFDEKLSNLSMLISTMARKVISLEEDSRIFHIRIIDSILAGTPENSESLMKEHITHTFQCLIHSLKPSHQLNIIL